MIDSAMEHVIPNEVLNFFKLILQDPASLAGLNADSHVPRM